ncbi:MAG TPA: DedA family protein, partial [Anaeromyxobacteraceae bacterium]|nr:DedA family protein [Anaeromyxobacteraceae bacterium]
LLFGGVSAALWNALLLGAGGLLVGNLDELVRLLARYTSAAWIGMAAVAALLGIRALVRRRSGREERR